MEIHKPKPIHNWREFLKEVGTIVLGVCIALAAEQSVEWWHWQSEVKTARQAIHAEMAGNNTNTFARRIALSRCFLRQADEAERILDDLEAGRPPGSFTHFKSNGAPLVVDSEWQSQRSSQALTHFPHEELALMGRYYDQKGRFADWGEKEVAAWQDLGTLRQPPRNIVSSDLIRLRSALGTVREMERVSVLNATRLLNFSRLIGVATVPTSQAEADKYCAQDQEEVNGYLLSRPLR